MKIHEYQGKEILKRFGVPVPEWVVATTVAEAVEASARLGPFPVVIKAQIHAGGRGKGGGIKLAHNREDVGTLAGNILGMQLKTPQTGPQGQKVRRIIVSAGTDIAREIYVALLLDRATSRLTFLISNAGGMDIEEVAQHHPEKLLRVPVDTAVGLLDHQVREMAWFMELDKAGRKSASAVLRGMYRAYTECECSLVEINPLAVTPDGRLVAVDVKVNLDDNALFLHPELEALRDPDEEDPKERQAKEHDLSYIALDGNVGCMVNGAGLAMATMDAIKASGGEPANFLDVGGGATEQKVTAAFKLILSDPNVKAVLVNIFGGIAKCDVIANGVVGAARQVGLKVPLVVRLEGTNVDIGRKLLAESGLPIITADGMRDAADKVVKAARTA